MSNEIAYKQEELTPALQAEIHRLITDYYAATPAHTDIPPYDFMWEVYEALDQAGSLVVCTARDEAGKLVGVALYVISPVLHHRGRVAAVCDSLSVDHAQRGKGVGRALVECAAPILAERGVHCVVHHDRTCYGDSPLFPKLGFRQIERVWLRDV